MTEDRHERAWHFPAIERRYGKPMAHWFDVVAQLDGLRFPEQVAHLREQHGFSRTHAQALVLHTRGSTTARRFTTVEEYLAGVDPVAAATVRSILACALAVSDDLECVIAWNHPMVRRGRTYVFGVSVASHHLLIAPHGEGVLDTLRPLLQGYTVNRKTVRVPLDWQVDPDLLEAMVAGAAAGEASR